MNSIKKTLLAGLFVVTLQVPFVEAFAALEGPGGSGGGNSIEAQFEQARSDLRTAVDSADANSLATLPESYRTLIQNYGPQLSAELSLVTLEMDYKTTKPFIHENGSKTGIATDIGVPFAPIRIRTKVLVPSGQIANKKVMMLLAHEISHHLPPVANFTEEQKAWAFANALTMLADSSDKYPELLNLNGDYVAIGGEKCRNAAHIEADPKQGIIIMTITTTAPPEGQVGCLRSLEQSTTNVYRAQTIEYDSGPRRVYSFESGAILERGGLGRDDVTVMPDGGVFVKFVAGTLPRGDRINYFNQKYVKLR